MRRKPVVTIIIGVVALLLLGVFVGFGINEYRKEHAKTEESKAVEKNGRKPSQPVASVKNAASKEKKATELQPETSTATAQEQQPGQPNPRSQQPIIESFAIVPSAHEGNWMVYSTGAKAVLKGENIIKVEIWGIPGGTGMSPELIGQAEEAEKGVWEYAMPGPPNVLHHTNFWAVVYGKNGQQLKSTDLGEVSWSH